MFKLFYFLLPLLFFIGCKDSNFTDIKVSPNIIKIAYLSQENTDNDNIYTIENNGTEGNVTLLDETTGRYSYLSAKGMINRKDSFTYTVRNKAGVSKTTQVHIEITDIDITINDQIQKNFSSNLPIVIIDTGDQEILDDPKIKGGMTIIEPNDNNRSYMKIKPSYSGYMEIEIRGQFSQYFPKKQYSVDTETWDEENNDVSLLGMPEEHKWVLNGPYSDKSLMRNYLAYHKTREINESKYYAVRSKFVELFKRKNNYYQYDGVYVFMEKIVRDKNRLDIEKLKNEDTSDLIITGGYMLQQDRVEEKDVYITGFNEDRYIIKYPKEDDINIEQKNYIEDYVYNFENALYSNDYNDIRSINHYENWIDEESFIIHILAREFFKDYDSWKYSEYFYKDRNSKLSMGPIWDFNEGMGNNPFYYDEHTKGWAYESKNLGMGLWVSKLMENPIFKQKIITKWFQLRSTIWSDNQLIQFVDSTKKVLNEAAIRNFERWPVLGKNVFLTNRKACLKDDIPIYCDTFESAVNEHLKVWLLERAIWMDTQFKYPINNH